MRPAHTASEVPSFHSGDLRRRAPALIADRFGQITGRPVQKRGYPLDPLLKTERTARKVSRARGRVGTHVFDHIERPCNPHRRHSKPGHVSHREFETRVTPA